MERLVLELEDGPGAAVVGPALVVRGVAVPELTGESVRRQFETPVNTGVFFDASL